MRMSFHAALVAALLAGPALMAGPEAFPGGYCVLLKDGGDPVAGVDYEFNNLSGVVTLKRGGAWRVVYQDRADLSDTAAVSIDVRGVISEAGGAATSADVEIVGRNLAGSVALDAISASGPRRLRLTLRDGGAITTTAVVAATTFDLVDSLVPGDLAGVLRVRSVVSGQSSSALDVGGHVAGTLDVLYDIGGPLDAARVHVAGNLAATGRIQVGQTLFGTLVLDGDVLDGVNNWIRIRRMAGGRLECRDLDLRLAGGADWLVIGHGLSTAEVATTTHTGSVAIRGTLRGRLYIRGYSALDIDVAAIDAAEDAPWRDGGIEASSGFTADARVAVASFVRGRIGLPRDVLPGNLLPSVVFDAAIDVQGALPPAARIDTLNPGTSGGQRAIDLGGVVHVRGDFSGKVQATGGLVGQVRIDGSLLDGVAGDEVEIAGPRSGIGAVTVDYDGWHAGHNWASGAVVRIGGQAFTQNTPAARVWETTCCRGDLDNDGSVNFFDIDPYLLVVLSVEGPGSYSNLFPGLDGSRIYHADLNCDGSSNFFDIDPFVATLLSGACTSDCASSCNTPGGSGSGS